MEEGKGKRAAWQQLRAGHRRHCRINCLFAVCILVPVSALAQCVKCLNILRAPSRFRATTTTMRAFSTASCTPHALRRAPTRRLPAYTTLLSPRTALPPSIFCLRRRLLPTPCARVTSLRTAQTLGATAAPLFRAPTHARAPSRAHALPHHRAAPAAARIKHYIPTPPRGSSRLCLLLVTSSFVSCFTAAACGA